MTIDMKQLYREEKVLIGCNSLMTSLKEAAEDLNGMTAAFERGELSVSKDEDLEKVGIEDAVKAYDGVRGGDGKKYVIVF